MLACCNYCLGMFRRDELRQHVGACNGNVNDKVIIYDNPREFRTCVLCLKSFPLVELQQHVKACSKARRELRLKPDSKANGSRPLSLTPRLQLAQNTIQ